MTPDSPAVVVITPTVGAPELVDAVISVQAQSYPNVEHLVVVDGPEYENQVREILLQVPSAKVTVLVLPYNTGAGWYFGHRIFAGLSQLIPHQYVFFLDEDNLYTPEHVESLVTLMSTQRLDWAHSLRTLIDSDGTALVDDNSVSIGAWEIDGAEIRSGVDTSCYAFTKKFLTNTGHIWNYRGSGDWNYFYAVKSRGNYACTARHTLLYRLKKDPQERSRVLGWVLNGNFLAEKQYGIELPWKSNTT